MERHHLVLLLLSVLAGNVSAAEPAVAGSASTFSSGAEWLSYNKSLDGQRYSPLTQINRTNAAELTEVCRVQVDDSGSFQAGLIVVDDVMYATTATDTLALNPVNCEVIWRVSYRREDAAPFPVNRGVAYNGGRLFRGTDDGRVIALDARTGQELWSNIVGEPGYGEVVTGSPLVWNGLLIVGTAVSEFGSRGRVIAFDTVSGREIWRFNTVPAEGEPNYETWGGSVWNTITGGGGGSWSHFALDPSTAEVFIPVGNPIPDFVPAERPGDNLYTNCVLVLDARTGQLKWWYQLAPSDGLDHDLAAAPVLYRNSKGERRVAAAGKDGYLHIIDRETHQRLARTAVTTVTEPVAVPTPEGIEACPGPAGGVEWNGPAFHPELNRLFVGSLDYCALFMAEPGTKPAVGGYNMGGTWSGLGTPRGWIVGIDADSGEVAWRYHADYPVVGALTATAGNVLFGGDNAGKFLVFDADTGEILKEVATGGSLSGGLITYAQRGRQYVAMTSGNISRSLFGAMGRPSILIMALPQAVIAAGQNTAASSAARGHVAYGRYCAVCHGAQGSDWQNVDLKAVKRKMNAEQLVAFMRNPRAPMPKPFAEPWSSADEQRARDIAAFLMQWQ